MQSLFEMFTFLELIILALFIEGLVLVLIIKVGLYVARRMNWISQEKYMQKKLKHQTKNGLSRYKPAFYVAAIVMIPFFLGVTVNYNDDKTPYHWTNSTDDELSQSLHAEITQYIVDNDIPQLCIGIKQAHKEQSFCVSQLNENTLNADSVFEIGSISKTFTITAMLQILARHDIDLNSSIAPFLPDSLVAKNPALGAITWRQLATHTAGLSRMPMGANLNTLESLFDALTMNNNAAAFDDPYILSYLTDAKVDASDSTPPSYSNLGFGLLGYLLTVLEQQDYANIITNEVITPLSLARTAANNRQWQNRARGYGQFRTVGNYQVLGKAAYMSFSNMLAGAGAVNSSVNDMMQYLNSSIALYQTPIYQQKTHQIKFTERTNINLGWFVSNISHDINEKVVWHDGGTAGFRSYMGFIESGEAGVVILSSGTKRVDPLGTHLLKQLLNNDYAENPTLIL